jgi:hypothetical protein
VGITRSFVTGSRGEAGGIVLFEAETNGTVITVEESANDGLRGSWLRGWEHVGPLQQLLTARNLRNEIIVVGAFENREENLLVHSFDQSLNCHR